MFSNLHIYKNNSILKAVATGVDPSDIKVFVEHHKGRSPTKPWSIVHSRCYNGSSNMFSLFVGLVCGSFILILNGLLVAGGL
jgi:hypothetical protein